MKGLRNPIKDASSLCVSLVFKNRFSLQLSIMYYAALSVVCCHHYL